MNKIYVIEKNNVPVYIGKTTGFSVRLFYHRKTYGNDISWYFIDEVEDWKFWEQHYISLFKSWGFKLGNKNKGGGGPTNHTQETIDIIKHKKTGMKYNITEESRKNKSKKLTGRKFTDETKEKIRQSKINHPCYTKERNDKISKGNSKPVIQLDEDMNLINEYKSYNEAKKITGIDPQHCLVGKRKTAGGYIWKYKNYNI